VIRALARAAAVAAAFASAAGIAAAQPRVQADTAERRTVAASLERELASIGARQTPVWAAYTLQTIPSGRQMCPGSHVALERTTELVVMVRIEAGAVQRLRSFTPECEIDARGAALVWLDGVTPDASAAWLTSLVRSTEPGSERKRLVSDPALAALGLNAGNAATRSLLSLAQDDARTAVRGQALVWLAQRAGQESVAAIGNALDKDPETDVKRQAVYALSRLPPDQGVPLLIQVARTHQNIEVRRQAMLYLGRSNDRRAVGFFEEVLLK
jgi:hypothetical protein